jgi:hypothetical protein
MIRCTKMSPERMALARKAMTLLDELTVELPDNHVLLDDIYFHRALVAGYRGDSAVALRELRELRRRCPNTDLAAQVKSLAQELSSGSRLPERSFE